MSIDEWLQRRWYTAKSPHPWLRSLSDAVAARVYARMEKRRVMDDRLYPKVVVVGNITVGGTGKTPLILALAQALQAAGHRVGIISRGYGGRGPFPLSVDASTPPAQCGDEPALLARRLGVPLVVSPNRCEALEYLMASHALDIVISDDGLQHYRLPRSLELVVIDGSRGLGNGCLLPVGPLREPPRRLSHVDALIINGPGELVRAPTHDDSPWGAIPPIAAPQFRMRLEPEDWCDLAGRSVDGSPGLVRPVVAMTGIGNPARFFASLGALGITCDTRIFPDHHRFSQADFLPYRDFDVVVTEKDAVKLDPAWVPHVWVLRVNAIIEPDILTWIISALGQRPD